MQKGREGLCERHFTSLEHTLNNFTSELSVNYFSECYWIKETCNGNSFRNIGPFMFGSQAFQLSFQGCCCFSLSLSLCAPTPFCLLPTPYRLPLPSATPIVYSASKPSQKHLCDNNLSPSIPAPTYSTPRVQEKCIFQSIHLEKSHRLKTLRLTLLPNSCARGAHTGQTPT